MDHSGTSDTERIVVGMDATSAAGAALRWALREAVLRSARVVAVAAWEVPTAQFNLYRSPAYEQLKIDVAGECAQSLDRSVQWARSLEEGTGGVRVDSEVHEGSAADVLCAASRDASLIVLGTRGQHAWKRTLLGSTSTAVLQRAECPVVVLRATKDQPGLAEDAEVKAFVDAWH